MSPHTNTEHLRELQERLWSERHLLDFLLFKLTAAKLILAANETRFVAPALAEVEHVVEKIRLAEVGRAMAVSKVAQDWGVRAADVSLSYLADQAPEPARTMFIEHRDGFNKLTVEIEEVALENRRLASGALTNIRENLDALMGHDGNPTYTPTGRRVAAPVGPRRLDRAL